MSVIRYPFAPLALAFGPEASNRDVAVACDVTQRTVQRWKQDGLTADAAAAAADAIREHPFTLWPEMADHILEEVNRSDEERHERTKAVQRRAWRKKWSRMTEAEKEAKREYVRQYREHARGAIRAQRRRYYAENRDQELARQRDYDARKRAERKAS